MEIILKSKETYESIDYLADTVRKFLPENWNLMRNKERLLSLENLAKESLFIVEGDVLNITKNSNTIGGTLTGLSQWRKDEGVFKVWINRDKPVYIQLLSVGHEIAHTLIHHAYYVNTILDYPLEIECAQRNAAQSPKISYIECQEAEYFAKRLLKRN